MLHGYPPFKNLNNSNFVKDSYFEIFKSVISNVYIIDNKINLSNECIDIINRLLENDCKKRINIKQIFFHPWVQKFQNLYDEDKSDKNNIIDSKFVNNNINVSIQLDNNQLNSEQNNNLNDIVYENTLRKIEKKKKQIVKFRNTYNKIRNKNTKEYLLQIKILN